MMSAAKSPNMLSASIGSHYTADPYDLTKKRAESESREMLFSGATV